MGKDKLTTDEILRKYGAKIEGEMKGFNSNHTEDDKSNFSRSYKKFRGDMVPKFSRYEKWCKALGNFLKVKVSEKDRVRIQKEIDVAHLELTPSEVFVFSVMALIFTLFGGILVSVGIFLFTGEFSMLILLLVVVLSMFLFYFANNMPSRIAQQWRLKASSQMVPAILYLVIYMKHTSNFEKAVEFASKHLEEPLSLDFKKIFWDVEVGRFSSVKDSVDNYLECWRDYSVEFIEAFHLIESSLYEPSEARRIQILEKSLQVILDGVYDKMLKYTHDVKSPLTNIYMLGIVLPTLAIAILPLASTMLQGAIQWYHVFLIFNLIVPFLVMYMTWNVMSTRPGGYGEASLLEKNPLYYKYKSKKPYGIATLVCLPLLLIGLIPLFWMMTDLPILLGMEKDYVWSSVGLEFFGSGGMLGIMTNDAGKVIAGPHGALSLILSLFVPLSIALFFIISFKMRTKELIFERDKYKQVEREFTSSLFHLGNRIGDGLPAEIAFAKVAESSKGTKTEGFFKMVNGNIQRLGMSLKDALFNPKRGAVVFYPSQLISTSMGILVESVKKGLQVAARALMSISEYVKNIKKINDRLNDLLADIISDMKSNMVFLAPLLSGIIVGLSGMITTILGSLDGLFNSGSTEGVGALAGGGGMGNLLSIFDVTTMIPTYWLQVSIGIYIIQIAFILTGTLVTIKSGRDLLQQTSETGKNLKSSIILYLIVALFAICGLTLLGGIALSGLGG